MILKARFDRMVAKDKRTDSAPYVEVLHHELNDAFTAHHDVVPPKTYSASEGIIENTVVSQSQRETQMLVSIIWNLEVPKGKRNVGFNNKYTNVCGMLVHKYLEVTFNM